MLRPLSFINDYPKDRNNGWHSNVQGVTHDTRNWYVTQRYRLWKFGVGRDLNTGVTPSGAGVRSVHLDDLPVSGYDHFGDLDYFDGELFVPLEDVDDEDTTPAVAVFSARDLRFRYHGRLTHNDHDKKAPWCAINPLDGMLYTSSFWINREHGHLKVYSRRTFSTTTALEFERPFILRNASGSEFSLDRVQGGAFSRRGNLYLVSDTEAGGIFGFDGRTGRLIQHTVIRYAPGDGEELEGITIWDLDSGAAPGIRGEVHVLMIDEDTFSDDDLYFKHFRVDPRDSGLL